MDMKKRLLRVTKIAGCLALTLFVGSFVFVAVLGSQQPEHVTLPKPSGPFSVGREGFDWTDTKREDVLAPQKGVKRALTGWIWYPAKPAGEQLAEYLPGPLREALAKQANPAVRTVAQRVTTDPENVTGHALETPALTQSPAKFPLILLKPGRGGFAAQYSVFAEELASHGYIVVGSNSPYTTPVVVHEDATVILRSPAGSPSESAPGRISDLAPGQPNDLSVPVIEEWARDNTSLVDHLRTTENRFRERIDFDAIGAFGHSYGGAAALEFCHLDSRCTAGVNLDGALWGEVVRAGLPKPFLFLMSDRPVLTQSPQDEASKAFVKALDRIRAGLPNQPNAMVLKGSQHYNFADSALLTEPRIARGAGMIGEIDPLEAIAITSSYVVVFFDHHLKQSVREFPPNNLVQALKGVGPDNR